MMVIMETIMSQNGPALIRTVLRAICPNWRIRGGTARTKRVHKRMEGNEARVEEFQLWPS